MEPEAEGKRGRGTHLILGHRVDHAVLVPRLEFDVHPAPRASRVEHELRKLPLVACTAPEAVAIVAPAVARLRAAVPTHRIVIVLRAGARRGRGGSRWQAGRVCASVCPAHRPARLSIVAELSARDGSRRRWRRHGRAVALACAEALKGQAVDPVPAARDVCHGVPRSKGGWGEARADRWTGCTHHLRRRWCLR